MKTMIVITSKAWGIDNMDLQALKLCLKLKQEGSIHSITGITIGNPHSLKHALSLGLDHGIHIDAPHPSASLLQPHIQKIDMIFSSNQESPFGSLPHIIAGMLNWPCIPFTDQVLPKHVYTLPPKPTSLYPTIHELSSPKSLSSFSITSHNPIIQREKRKHPKQIFSQPDTFIQALIQDGILE